MTDDRLAEMMLLQSELQREAYWIDVVEFDDEEKIQYIRVNVLACTDELHEALNETGWKPWSSNNTINEEAFKNELVDAWHFMMNLINVIGMSPDELHQRYLAKREKNVKRQEDGYDNSNKCPVCKRAYDDDAVTCSKISEFGGVPYFNCATLNI